MTRHEKVSWWTLYAVLIVGGNVAVGQDAFLYAGAWYLAAFVAILVMLANNTHPQEPHP